MLKYNIVGVGHHEELELMSRTAMQHKVWLDLTKQKHLKIIESGKAPIIMLDQMVWLIHFWNMINLQDMLEIHVEIQLT